MAQARNTAPQCGIKVYQDKGSLALRFPVKYNPVFEELDGKAITKQKCLGLGLKYSEANWRRATQIAIDIENDLEHKDWLKLFDSTLGKYGIGNNKYKDKLTDVLQLPSYVPEMTVGEMWEDYLVWKEPQLEATTFSAQYERTYTNILKGKVWDNTLKTYQSTGTGVYDLPLSPEVGQNLLLVSCHKAILIATIRALNEAFTRAQSLGKVKLSINPFFKLHKKTGDNTKEKYKQTVTADGEVLEWWQIQDANEDEQERDRRAFTKEERDAIIKGFYESQKDNERHAAPLIKFLFLTGCRPGEAFALRWQDVMFERGYIRFSKSYAGSIKETKRTKTKSIRMFKLYPKLVDLLTQIKPDISKGTDLVFKQQNGRSYNTDIHSYAWLGCRKNYVDKTYFYPGVVTRLVEQGIVSGYLPPYHARHTFITLQAHANKSDVSALVLIAHSCGNSVEIIQKHYLGIDKNVELANI